MNGWLEWTTWASVWISVTIHKQSPQQLIQQHQLHQQLEEITSDAHKGRFYNRDSKENLCRDRNCIPCTRVKSRWFWRNNNYSDIWVLLVSIPVPYPSFFRIYSLSSPFPIPHFLINFNVMQGQRLKPFNTFSMKPVHSSRFTPFLRTKLGRMFGY